jgi:hypothetical protein
VGAWGGREGREANDGGEREKDGEERRGRMRSRRRNREEKVRGANLFPFPHDEGTCGFIFALPGGQTPVTLNSTEHILPNGFLNPSLQRSSWLALKNVRLF